MVVLPVVFDHHIKGKTICFKIALAVCSKRPLLSFLTESSSHYKMERSLPFAYDDPSNSETDVDRSIWRYSSIEKLMVTNICKLCTFDQCQRFHSEQADCR